MTSDKIQGQLTLATGSQKKKINKVEAETKQREDAEAKASLSIPPEVLKEIHKVANERPLPLDSEERHNVFIEFVGQAEALLQRGERSSRLENLVQETPSKLFPQDPLCFWMLRFYSTRPCAFTHRQWSLLLSIKKPSQNPFLW